MRCFIKNWDARANFTCTENYYLKNSYLLLNIILTFLFPPVILEKMMSQNKLNLYTSCQLIFYICYIWCMQIVEKWFCLNVLFLKLKYRIRKMGLTLKMLSTKQWISRNKEDIELLISSLVGKLFSSQLLHRFFFPFVYFLNKTEYIICLINHQRQIQWFLNCTAAMMLLDNIGFVANMVSLVLYFLYVMHFDYSGSATTTTNLLGTAFLLTIVGGFISDTYMNRLNTCILFGIIQLLVKYKQKNSAA